MRSSLAGIAAVLVLLAGAPPPLDEPVAPASTASSSHLSCPSSPATAVPYYAFVDPETGEFTDAGDPESIPLSEDLLNRISSSDTGLVEEAGSVSGVTVRLHGRFSSLAVSTAGEHGEDGTRCLSGLPVATPAVKP